MIKVGRVLFAAGRGAMGCGLSITALILAAPGLAHAQTASEKSSDALPPITVEAAQPSKAKKKKAYKAPASAPAAAEAETAAADPSNESTVKGPLGKGADVTITSKDLDRTQPQTIQNLYSSQTAVTAGGTTQASTKVYVHGIEETMLNVQIDGARQAQRNGFHHNGNNVIDPSMLKGVAIDAGAASADAGPNALGGAIRYTTKDVSDLLKDGQKLGGFAALSYDTNSSTFKKSGSAYGKSNGFEILGYASGADGNSYEDGHGNTVAATDVDLVNYLGKLAYESPEGHRFAVSGEHVSDEGLRPFRTNLSVLHPGFAPAYAETERDTFTFKYTSTKPTAWYDPEVSFYSNDTRLDRHRPAGVCGVAVASFGCTAYGVVDIESIGGKVQNTFVVGPGKLTTGVDFYRDETHTVHPADMHPNFAGSFGETLTNFGAYAQYRFEPIEHLRVSTGLRADANRLEAADGSEHDTSGVSPNISLEYDLTRQLTAKASYGYSFGGIPLYEAILLRPNNPASYDPGLDPQKSESYKAGLAFEESGLLIEASYFNTRITDPVCPSCTVVVNDGDIETRGVDVSARYSWRSGTIGANYIHAVTEFDGGPLSPTAWYYGTPVGDQLKIFGHYEFERTGFAVGFLSQFVFDYDELENFPGPGGVIGVLEGYDVHNVYAQWVPNFAPSLTLRADVLNVFDTYYIDRANAFGGSLVPIANQGRTFLLSGKVEF
ncbi:TonB-dependent receptor domain-containing protein [Hyphomicrobium sp. LHD-15]|uniref:TonB-dependent receptor domain-containing protein n=1 Tax=Hyphomicrobium sp. LHD-15 TaxID=3072142 RepID=UPI00281010A0|nr:TonB-dependent receptor [Hyphomicrobium sp. LHD-15]MDQ8697610.1 TonB-dependent receptor [Hyphomicrobium sp. LHD-15]